MRERTWACVVIFCEFTDEAAAACSGRDSANGSNSMAQSTKRKLMKVSDIPAFVDEIVETGCDICAVGHDKYVLGDADLSPDEYEKVRRKLDKIEDNYGDRDFLRLEIVAHLRSIGRYIDVGADGAG